MQAGTWQLNSQNVRDITFWSFIWLSQAWRGVTKNPHLFWSGQCVAAVLHLCSWCPQTKSWGEAPLCNLCSWWTPPWMQPQEGEGQCCVSWGLGWAVTLLYFCLLGCRSLAGPAIVGCALQVTMSSDAPVKTVRSSRLWLCGFLLDARLRGRHSGHFVSF